MSGVHLFDGDALAEDRYFPGGYVAVCGTLVRPHSAPDEGADPTYCPACVHAAAGFNRPESYGAAAEVGTAVPTFGSCVPAGAWPVHVR